jgi:hypothetical protein
MKIVAELPLNKREQIRIEAKAHPSGNVVMTIARWKADANGIYHRAGSAFSYGLKRASDIAALIAAATAKTLREVQS